MRILHYIQIYTERLEFRVTKMVDIIRFHSVIFIVFLTQYSDHFVYCI